MWTDLSSRLIDTAKSTLGLTRGGNKPYKELWWWNEERIATKAVARAKSMAYDDMYEELHTKIARKGYKRSSEKIIICLKQKNNKARGPNDIPIESLKALGDDGIHLTNLYNKILGNEEIPQKWRQSYLVPIFKNKGDPHNCQNYRGIKLMSHCLKLYENIIDKRLCDIIQIGETQFGFMPGRSTTDAIHNMYMGHTTMVRSTTGTSTGFTIAEGVHQGSAFSLLLFKIVIDVLVQSIPQTVPWSMIFADDIVILAESKDEMKERLMS
ncbi:uncharacterized protein LOC135924503 [Gordionus sp. m RMFG-2023]|uniref:uncharacterized protein LOC135924503 n=1 Tax=Gordionus sp. m RMFG-2023 TaxID=3053472 RepID=UPI0031FDBD33